MEIFGKAADDTCMIIYYIKVYIKVFSDSLYLIGGPRKPGCCTDKIVLNFRRKLKVAGLGFYLKIPRQVQQVDDCYWSDMYHYCICAIASRPLFTGN